MREIQVTMTLVIEDLDENEIRELIEIEGTDPDEIAGPEDIDLYEIQDSIEHLFTSNETMNEYFWAGSGVYAKIESCRVTAIEG